MAATPALRRLTTNDKRQMTNDKSLKLAEREWATLTLRRLRDYKWLPRMLRRLTTNDKRQMTKVGGESIEKL